MIKTDSGKTSHWLGGGGVENNEFADSNFPFYILMKYFIPLLSKTDIFLEISKNTIFKKN